MEPTSNETAAVAPRRFEGRFTPADGLRGWLQARATQQPFYGTASLEIASTSVSVRGWQRNWLGAQEAVEKAFTPLQIRNSVRTGNVVRFEAQIGRRWRALLFVAGDATAATELLEAMPQTRTAGFDETWAGLQEFNRVLDAGNHRTWVTPAFVIANIAAFAALLYVGDGGIDPLSLARWGNTGLLTTQGEWWRLLSAAFLHWNLLHIALNMWALWNAGRLVERLYGSVPYAGIYLASGVIGNLASTLWNPALTTAGASGAVFGVLGAMLACMLTDRGLPQVVVKAHRWSTLGFVLLNLLLGTLSTGVDNAAHVGGLVTGFALGWLLARPTADSRRAGISPQRATLAVALVGVALALGTHALKSPTIDPTGPYAWTQRHAWYLDGEMRHMRIADRLNWQLQAGQISPADYADAVQSDLLPFLEDAGKRLSSEATAGPTPAPAAYSALARRFVEARHAWLQSVVTAIESSSAEDTARAATLQDVADRAQARLAVAQAREQFNGRWTGWRAALHDRYWTWQQAQPDGCVRPPSQWRRVASTTDARSDGPWLRRAAGCQAQHQLLQRDFQALEDDIAAALASLNDLPDGTSTYAGIFDGLSDLFRFGRVPPELLLERFADWRRQFPGSAIPDLLEADFYQQLAWAARGGGTAETVRAQDWQLFHYRIRLAQAIMDEIDPRAHAQPYWHTNSIHLALEGSATVEEMRALFDAGAQTFPGYLPLYKAMLRVLMPRWKGSTAAVNDFIDEVSRSRGDSMYARLHAYDARLEGDDGNVLEGNVDWDRIRSGFEQLQQQHAASDFILNEFAYMACRRGDARTYAGLSGLAGQRASSTAWSEGFSLASCDGKFALAEPVALTDPVGTPFGGKERKFSAADVEWIKRQTEVALAAAEPVRTAITQYVELHGSLPSDAVLRDAPEFKAVDPMGAAVTIGLGASIDMQLIGGPLDGKKFSWTPIEKNGKLQWWCAQEKIPEELLGPPCR
ncbi:MAG: rhomboid family intramembrane serine protease [Steroidobacteraceae bacterium]